MTKFAKLPPIENLTQRMCQLIDTHLTHQRIPEMTALGDDHLWCQFAAGSLKVGSESLNSDQCNDLRLPWILALIDFFLKRKSAPHALYQLGPREVESYLRDANHLAAFELLEEHERFHYTLQEQLTGLIVNSVLGQTVSALSTQSSWPAGYIEQLKLLKDSIILPLQEYFQDCFQLEALYYGFKADQWVLVWNIEWSGPSLLWTESTKLAFQKGFLQAGTEFCREHLFDAQLKWVAELDQLP